MGEKAGSSVYNGDRLQVSVIMGESTLAVLRRDAQFTGGSPSRHPGSIKSQHVADCRPRTPRDCVVAKLFPPLGMFRFQLSLC